MENTIKVIIKPEHFRDAAGGYGNDTNKDGTYSPCVLGQALIEMFPDGNIGRVWTEAVSINNTKYRIPSSWGNTGEEFSYEVINDLSRKAKQSLDGIPTTEVILTKISADSDN